MPTPSPTRDLRAPGAVLLAAAELLDPLAFLAHTASGRRAMQPRRDAACDLALRLRDADLLCCLPADGRRTWPMPWPEQQQAVARVIDPEAFLDVFDHTMAFRRDLALEKATRLRDSGLLR